MLGIFRERELLKDLSTDDFKKLGTRPNSQFHINEIHQKKLLEDQGQLHIHAKAGRFSNAVTPRTDFNEKMMPLRPQKCQAYTEDLRA